VQKGSCAISGVLGDWFVNFGLFNVI
jgi:hypothetical protein